MDKKLMVYHARSSMEPNQDLVFIDTGLRQYGFASCPGQGKYFRVPSKFVSEVKENMSQSELTSLISNENNSRVVTAKFLRNIRKERSLFDIQIIEDFLSEFS